MLLPYKCQACREPRSMVRSVPVKGHPDPNVRVECCALCYDYFVPNVGPTQYWVKPEKVQLALLGDYWFQRQKFLTTGDPNAFKRMMNSISLTYPDMDRVVAQPWPKSKFVPSSKPSKTRYLDWIAGHPTLVALIGVIAVACALGGVFPIAFAMDVLMLAYIPIYYTRRSK